MKFRHYKNKVLKVLLAVILMISLWVATGYTSKSSFMASAKSQNELILSNRKTNKVARSYRLNFNSLCIKSAREELYKPRFEQRIQIHNSLAQNKIKHIAEKHCSVEPFDGFGYLKTIPWDSDNSNSFSFPRG